MFNEFAEINHLTYSHWNAARKAWKIPKHMIRWNDEAYDDQGRAMLIKAKQIQNTNLMQIFVGSYELYAASSSIVQNYPKKLPLT